MRDMSAVLNIFALPYMEVRMGKIYQRLENALKDNEGYEEKEKREKRKLDFGFACDCICKFRLFHVGRIVTAQSGKRRGAYDKMY